MAALVVGTAAGALPAAATPVPGAPTCPTFPADSYWHARADALPVDPSSDTYVANAGAGSALHADFGAGLDAGGPIGIPYTTVSGTEPKVPVVFDDADESDPGPYPVPPGAPIEGGAASSGDRHVLVVDRDHCVDYELYAAYPHGGGTSWSAGSGAVFDLTSNAMRPRGWTSADAAGLPILPGLVRYDEVAAGEIDHPIRITLARTDRRFVWPARHQAGVADATAAPMGAWLRLKPTVDVSRFGPQSRVILRGLRDHGAIVADNGSSWFLSGVPDARWDNDDLHGLGVLRGSDFEFVDASSLAADPDSGRVSTTPVRSDLTGGLTLDGFGGLHRFAVGAGRVSDGCVVRPTGTDGTSPAAWRSSRTGRVGTCSTGSAPCIPSGSVSAPRRPASRVCRTGTVGTSPGRSPCCPTARVGTCSTGTGVCIPSESAPARCPRG